MYIIKGIMLLLLIGAYPKLAFLIGVFFLIYNYFDTKGINYCKLFFGSIFFLSFCYTIKRYFGINIFYDGFDFLARRLYISKLYNSKYYIAILANGIASISLGISDMLINKYIFKKYVYFGFNNTIIGLIYNKISHYVKVVTMKIPFKKANKNSIMVLRTNENRKEV